MTKKELYLKTVFCCIACDGEIAEEEISMVRELCTQDQLFANMDANKYIHAWIEEINKQGSKFLQNYLNLKSATLLKSQSVAAQTAKNAIFLVWTDFLPCVG